MNVDKCKLSARTKSVMWIMWGLSLFIIWAILFYVTFGEDVYVFSITMLQLYRDIFTLRVRIFIFICLSIYFCYKKLRLKMLENNAFLIALTMKRKIPKLKVGESLASLLDVRGEMHPDEEIQLEEEVLETTAFDGLLKMLDPDYKDEYEPEDSSSEEEINTTRYLSGKDFWFILRSKSEAYRRYVDLFVGGWIAWIRLQFKPTGQFAKKVEFRREEYLYNQQDYRPDINSNGPLKHKNALVQVYDVWSMRLETMELLICGMMIPIWPLKQINVEKHKKRVSQTLVQECSGIRTISRTKTESEVLVAVKSVLQNSTTVNLDKGEISRLHYVQEDTLDYMLYLHHHQAHMAWNGGLDFQ